MFTASIALSFAAAFGPAQDFGDYHALVIGNDIYQHHGNLNTAVSDAQAVAKLLEEDYGFEVDLLPNATSDEIRNALYDLRKIPDTDNILIYFAGHGALDSEADQGYWFGVNATDRPHTRVSNSDIRDEVKAMKAKHVLILSDSCFSGSLTRNDSGLRGLVVTGGSSKVSAEDLKIYRRLSGKKTRLVITSGGNEPVVDSGQDGHSVFAYKFLELLRENRSVVTGHSLFSPLKDYVSLNAPQDPKIGRMREVFDNGGDFLFVRTLGATPQPNPEPLKGPLILLRGQINQPKHQVATIRVEGQSAENRIFGSEAFFLPVATEATSLVLIAEVGGEERIRRTLEVGGSPRTERFQGRATPVHDFGSWRIPTLPVYVEGQIELPHGTSAARLRLSRDLSGTDDYDSDLHLLERRQGTGDFRLILPDIQTSVSLIVSADECNDMTVALRFDRAERGYRGAQRVRVLTLGELRLEPTRVEVSLDALKEQLRGRPLRLNDDQRRRFAEKGKRIGRRLLMQVATRQPSFQEIFTARIVAVRLALVQFPARPYHQDMERLKCAA
ncbi:MAG: hypothetical protein ACI9F9_002490 [Candidatus Paceibacteria bacterium]|jgi:hypothetical protein